MDQQRSALVKRIIKCCSCQPLFLTCVLSLNRTDQSFDAWPTVIQTSPQLINILHRIFIDRSYSTTEIP